jgi:hypothetical protein
MCPRRISTTVAIAAFMGVIEVAQILSLARVANTSAAEVTVPQSALDSLIGEPDRHFHRAADFYAKGDAQTAASEIRAAAALIRIEAGRGSAQHAAKLRTTATNYDAGCIGHPQPQLQLRWTRSSPNSIANLSERF